MYKRQAIGKIYKVVPTALISAAMRPSMPRQALIDQIDELLDALRLVGANLDVEHGREAVEQATEPLVLRGVIAVEG